MPPFSAGTVPSAGAKVALPNSMNEFCPEKPCQPSLLTHGGSMRPVDRTVEHVVVPSVWNVQTLGGSLLPAPPAIDLPVQSAPAQYTAPGTRKGVGTETFSAGFALFPPNLGVPHGTLAG